GAEIWGTQYSGPRAALVSLQRQMVDDVSRRLRPGSRHAERGYAQTMSTNPEAWDLYLKGLHAWNLRGKEDLLRSIDYFNRAIALDPRFALAYAGIANAYGVMIGSAYIGPAEGQLKA